MFVLMISRSDLGYVGSKTRSPGHSVKPCKHSSGHIYEAVIMNLVQNVCLDDFWVKFETGSFGIKTRSPGQIKGRPC